MGMQEPEGTVQAGRRYVLGYRDDFYGIWDREVPGKPVETFERSDAGLLEEKKRISNLASQDFWARSGPKALRWALFGGLAVWVFTGLVLWIGGSSVVPLNEVRGPLTAGLIVPPPYEPGWEKAVRVVENLAFRVWVAALAISFALWLLDRSRQPTESS
jgi:hypothetical protein